MICANCGQEIKGEEWSTHDDEIVCDECVERDFSRCSECGKLFKLSELSTVEGYGVCDDCLELFFTCAHCGKVFRHDARSRITNDGHTICMGCFERYYFTCGQCGEIYELDFESRDGICQDCDDDEILHDYDYKPEAKFFHLSGENPAYYFGVELEVGGGEDTYGVEYVPRDLYYCKEDSSIPDYGFEIVSHPASLGYHRARWEETDRFFKKLISAGYKSHSIDNCGLHIHVDKKALTNIEWVKLDFFINKNPSLVELLARRSSSYATIVYKNVSQCGKSPSRYSAINFRNKNTNEFRMFRGTLKTNTYIATIEIVEAMLRFARQVKSVDLFSKNAEKLFFDIVANSELVFAKEYIAQRIEKMNYKIGE